jgi:hypothetical protein
MSVIRLEKINLNQFYDKTPTALKYILIISLIIISSYVLFSKKVSNKENEELDKIEQTITTTYTLIDRFDDFKEAQYIYNAELLDYLKDIYTLVEELNENTNKKLDLILTSGGKNTNNIIEKLTMLNESFEKLQEAYTPNEFQETNSSIPDPRLINQTNPEYNINVRKISDTIKIKK